MMCRIMHKDVDVFSCPMLALVKSAFSVLGTRFSRVLSSSLLFIFFQIMKGIKPSAADMETSVLGHGEH